MNDYENTQGTRSGHRARFDDYPDVLTPQQAATLLQASPSHIYALCAQGIIPSFKLGRLVRIPKQPLLKWIEDGGVEPAGPVDFDQFAEPYLRVAK